MLVWLIGAVSAFSAGFASAIAKQWIGVVAAAFLTVYFLWRASAARRRPDR